MIELFNNIKNTITCLRVWKKLDEPDFFSTKKRKHLTLEIIPEIQEKYKFTKNYIELKYIVSGKNTKGLRQFYYSTSSTMYDVTWNDFLKIAYKNKFHYFTLLPEHASFQEYLSVIEYYNRQKVEIIPLEECFFSKTKLPELKILAGGKPYTLKTSGETGKFAFR